MESLPPLDKQLIYLDQLVISEIARALDPELRGGREPEERWLEIYDSLERASSLQLVVCPESVVHEHESSLFVAPDLLEAVYGHLSGGVRLSRPILVLERQLQHSLSAWLEGVRLADYSSIPRLEMLNEDPNQWGDSLQIRVRFPTTAAELEARRSERDRGYEMMADLWKGWQADPHGTFDTYYESERRVIPGVLLSLFVRHHLRLREAILSQDSEAVAEVVLSERIEVNLVSGLLRKLERAGVPEAERLPRLEEFLISDSALRAPQNDISSLLYAGLARRARSGQKRIPSPGTWNDVRLISAYLPYVDAMFIDNEFASLLQEGPLNERISYPTRIFSAKNHGELIEFLGELEEEIPGDRVDLVERAYGPNALDPNRGIVSYARTRRENT